MTETHLSPLRYPGGKARALSEIAPFFPAMESINEYREPFLGGGSVFLYLKENYGSYYPEIKWWVNDLEPYLYNFWVQVQLNVGELLERIDYFFEQPVSSIKLTKQNQDVDNAAIYYIKNKSTFGGMALNNIVKGNYDKFKDSYENNKENVIEKMVLSNKILQGVRITNWNYSRLIKEDSSEGTGDNTFVFLDPPYYTAKTLYGGTGKYNLHDTFDHYTFCEYVGRIAGSSNVKFMITYDDCQTIRHLYSKIPGVRIIPYEFRYSIAMGAWSRSSDVGHEIMIVNYKSENVITKQTVLC